LSGGISFRGFIDALQAAASEGQAAEAPIVEEGSDGVRLMTVHKAKGLEFPVVILADLTAKLTPFEASRHIDLDAGVCALRIGGWSPVDLLRWQDLEKVREGAEGVRIAYVAATRARDLLVVPAIGDQPYDGGWLSPLDRAIYPPADVRRQPRLATGCPPFKKDSVLTRPDDGVAMSQTVAPGAHTVDASGDAPFDVVWWDPATLALGAEPPFGLRRQELISRDVPLEIIAEGTARYVAWRNTREETVARAATPALEVRTITEWARDDAGVQGNRIPKGDSRKVETITIEATEGRPSGPRYGALVHASLAVVPLDAGEDIIGPLVATQGRVLGATADEVASARQVVRAVLTHPLLAAARAAAARGALFREAPTTILRDGQLLEGTVDLAFESADGFTVVDFKTDRAEGDLHAAYVRQVELYAEAIGEATGKPTRAVLMSI
jgi:ATP-dependent helicase/nuclease subunit A